jgi:hypothetical protein
LSPDAGAGGCVGAEGAAVGGEDGDEVVASEEEAEEASVGAADFFAFFSVSFLSSRHSRAGEGERVTQREVTWYLLQKGMISSCLWQY